MSAIVILYAVILLAVALGLWGAYRLLGTPSRLRPVDYEVVLEDLISSVRRSAERLRLALDDSSGGHLEEVAAESRKIFQTGYYQTLRLRPASGPDAATSVRELLGWACQAYEWASRMIGSEGVRNPLILEASRSLLDAGDRQLSLAARELAEVTAAP